MCASPSRGAAVADATAEEPCVCRRFASDIFVRSVRHCELHAVERSNPCRSFAGTAQSTGARRRQLSMDHRHRRPKDAVLRTAMSGRDESESGVTVAWHDSDAEKRIARTMVVAVCGKGRALRAIVLQTCRCGAVSIRG